MTAEAQLTTKSWKLDNHHSSVLFSVMCPPTMFRSGFKEFGAELQTDADGNPTALEGWADVASIDIPSGTFHDHMMADDIFDGATHSKLTFKSTSITARDGNAFDVAGELTIKGVTKSVTGHGTWQRASPAWGESIGLAISAEVDRTDFGVSWQELLPSGDLSLHNLVEIELDFRFNSQT
ncbi:MAG TPA: YceI family protein [Baekduia sp.]|nr:YceI family protein [Baekduia sp.]